MAKRQLRVVYDTPGEGPHIDEELDKAIEVALKPLGFTRWASGCDMVPPFERDLQFTKDLPELGRELAREAVQGLREG